LEDFLFISDRKRRQVLSFETLAWVIVFIRVRIFTSSIPLGLLNSCSLVLINKGNVLIVLHESQPGEDFLHHSVFEIFNDSELLEHRSILNHVLLNLLHRIVFIVVDLDRYLIGVIVQVNEAVVQEESAVALLAIAIIDLFSTLDVLNGFNDEPFFFIGISP